MALNFDINWNLGINIPPRPGQTLLLHDQLSELNSKQYNYKIPCLSFIVASTTNLFIPSEDKEYTTLNLPTQLIVLFKK